MVVATGRYCGVSSPTFAIAAVLSIIVMYDAMGVRYETGEQAKVLNRLLPNGWIRGLSSFSFPMAKSSRKWSVIHRSKF